MIVEALGALSGKVAWITGGGSGLGRAIVDRFIHEGAKVAVLDHSESRAAELTKAYSEDDICVTVGDVTNSDDNQRAVDQAREKFGRLDVFVGNAGIYDNRIAFAGIPLKDIVPAFDELFSVNVKGYLLGARAALDDLKRSQGCIVLTSSVSGVAAGFGGVLYVASKHAVVGIVRQLAWELAPRVRVNGVAPGYIPTGLTGLHSLRQGRTKTGPSAAQLPLGEVREASDFGDLYVLLASDGGRISTGSIFSADGGLALAGPAFRGWSE
jgi:NAD(P)-dependent dehydrogenase (short-subunit alcohol dehydrogenase family)